MSPPGRPKGECRSAQHEGTQVSAATGDNVTVITKSLMEPRIDAKAVADYLREHPQFFAEYADLVAEIFVPHPHGGHAISIAERQIITLREKNADLESRLRELLRYGSENDAISEKLHRSTLALFAAPDLDTTLAVLYESLKDDFGVPQVAARLWGKVTEQSYLPELAATSQDVRNYADQLGAPSCGDTAPFESRGWFDVPDTCRSFAFLPLRTSHTFGLLGLASDDPRRFYAGMGTVYLTRLGELTSVAAARYLPTV
jgi:uncharacterized protein YigA (DUF484 family)